MNEQEVRDMFGIPAEATLARQVTTEHYVSFLFEHRVGNKLVDGDRIVVKVNRQTGKAILSEFKWQDIFTPSVPRPGERVETVLVDPDNPFYIWDKKPPKNHSCLFVWDGAYLTIKDAETSEVIGHGVPPPDKALAVSGSHEGGDVWINWRRSAAQAFEVLGYDVLSVFHLDVGTQAIRDAIEDIATKAVYALAHGSASFTSIYTTGQIEYWMRNRDKMPFAFLGHCDGMCIQDDRSISYAFRKGSVVDVVAVGYCGMASNAAGWASSLNWQNKFFDYLIQGMTCGDAFEESIADYPECSGCILFFGDQTLKLEGGEPMANIVFNVNVAMEKKLYDVVVTVVDAGTPLVGVSLMIGERSGTTNEGGQHTFVGLVPGEYSLELSKTGYATKSVLVTLPS